MKVNDDGMLLLSNNLQVKKEAVITNAEEAIAVKRQEPIVEDEARDKLYVFFMLMVNKLLRFPVQFELEVQT